MDAEELQQLMEILSEIQLNANKGDSKNWLPGNMNNFIVASNFNVLTLEREDISSFPQSLYAISCREG